jgi:hypothetical protein
MTIRVVTLLMLALIAACTGSTVTSVDKHGGNVYALPVEVVDRMLVDAMSAEIPRGELVRGAATYPSYSGEVMWGALDTDTITAVAKPAIGRQLDGTEVDGFVFEVSRYGTAPATGKPTAERIHAKLQADAELTGTGTAFVRFK